MCLHCSPCQVTVKSQIWHCLPYLLDYSLIACHIYFAQVYLNYVNIALSGLGKNVRGNFFFSCNSCKNLCHAITYPVSPTMVEESTLQQIWRLTNELALQQSANKETINGITQQMSDVKVYVSQSYWNGVDALF